MNCFIASAFDYDDIDAIYDNIVCPVLAEFRIRPLRVDRVVHNNDIDDRIFQLIDQSHLCIADLTYARPSVYYEAGYAFGTGKPVIYLARRDHFHPHVDDPAGNLRVHFDLQMKNIIPWTAPNETLKKCLRRRLSHVLRPLLRKAKNEEAESEVRRRFEALSQVEKLSSLIAKAQSLLYSRGFKQAPKNKYTSEHGYGPLQHYPYQRHLLRIDPDELIEVHLLAFQGINKTDLQGLSWFWHFPSITNEQASTVSDIKSYCLIGALRSTRQQTLATLLPSWTPLENGVFKIEKTHQFHIPNKGKPEKQERQHTIVMIVVDGIRSQDAFASRIREFF